MKDLLLLFTILLSLSFAQAQETFPISPLGTQRVFVGAKIETNVSAVNQDLTSINLAGINMPSFGSFQDNGKGYGTYIFEPDLADTGKYLVSLQAISGTDTSKTSFQVIVSNLPDGNTYYVDPINGADANSGTSAEPWRTLENVFASSQSILEKDVIFLRSGNHGFPIFKGDVNDFRYVLTEKGATPMFEQVKFLDTRRWVLSGVYISPEANNTTAKGTYVNLEGNTFLNTIENCRIFGTSDVFDWPTNQDWYDHAGDGVIIRNNTNTFRNNYIFNTYFALTVFGDYNTISYNLFDTYGADCIRGLGNQNYFLYNRIQNALVDDYATGNHDDGFQSWSTNGPVKKVVLKGNQIFSHSDPSLPLKTSVLQGLVNFDGFSEDWVIEDNLILIDHPHGLTLLGARNCKVVNNTVVNNPLQLFTYGNPPWIRIGPHKNSAKSTGNLNRNNLMGFNYIENDPGTFGPNLIADYSVHFVDYAHWNFHLKPGSTPIDAGLKEGGSTLDNARNIRLDSFTDIGAYEYNSTFDFEPPSAVSNVQILETENSGFKISWAAATDNHGIKQYHVYRGPGYFHYTTDSLEVEIYGLNPNNDALWTIKAEDFAGNFSTITTQWIDLNEPQQDSVVVKITVSPTDQMIQSTNEQRWIGLNKHAVGGYTFFYDATAVLPFKIPQPPVGYLLTKADLIINYNRLVNTPKGSVDLYAIGIRNSPLVLSSDHWQGAYGTQPFGTPIQKEFLDKETLLGSVNTADTSTLHLATYLNTSGFPYVFLRINSDQDNESNYRFYEFMSGDHPDTKLRPRLELLYTKPVDTKEITKSKGLTIFPNPVIDKQPITINWPSTTFTGPVTLTITSNTGQIIAKRSYSNSLNSLELSSDHLPKNGIYYLVINDLRTYLVGKIVR